MDFVQLFLGLIGRILLGGDPTGLADAGSPGIVLKEGASPESDG